MSSTPLGATDEPVLRYRFGGFDLYPSQKALWREGVRVPLTPKSAETLLMLVEHAGQTLSKEDLLAQVWNGAAVEENNLAQSISVLRKTLGEKRGENRFILTDPGRGYRFIATVETVVESVAAPAMPTAGKPLGGRRVMALAASAVLLVAVAALALRPAASKLGRRNFVVLRFRELDDSGNTAWLGSALSETIGANLSNSQSFRRILFDDGARARIRLAQPDPVLLSPEDLTRMRQAIGADLVVAGSYSFVPSSEPRAYRVDAQIYDTHAGRVVGSAAETGEEASLFAMVSRVAGRIGQQVGAEPVRDSGSASATAKQSARDLARTLSLKAQFLPAGPDQEALYRQALEVGRKEGSGAWEIVPLNGLARIFAARKDFAKAADYFRQAYEAALASNGAEHPATLEAEIGWARARARTNQQSEAVAQIREAIPRAQRALTGDPERLWNILHDAIHGCNEAHAFQDAESYTKMALALNEQMHLPATSEKWGMLYWDLGRAKRGQKQFGEAFAAFQKAKMSFQFPDSRIDQVDRDIEITKSLQSGKSAESK